MVIYHRSETRINKKPTEDVTLTPSDSPGGVNYPSWRAGVWPDTGDSPKKSLTTIWGCIRSWDSPPEN